MKILFVLFIFIGGFINLAAQEQFVKPFDEAKKDASFLAFRTKLMTAAKKRDAKFILSIVDKDIRNTFGEDDGIRYFKKAWKIENSNSKFWEEFLTVLSNGGRFVKDGERETKIFFAPYTFTGFPDDFDAFEYQAIFGRDVNLRSKPDLKAPIVARLSYNIVKTDYENSVQTPRGDGYLWKKVETLGGKKGFVKAEFVRSPIDYRAGFEKKKGVWKMTVFIAGD